MTHYLYCDWDITKNTMEIVITGEPTGDKPFGVYPSLSAAVKAAFMEERLAHSMGYICINHLTFLDLLAVKDEVR